MAIGQNGFTPSIIIGENGNWFINGEDTGVAACGQNGLNGYDAPYITSIIETNNGFIFYLSDGNYILATKETTNTLIINNQLPFMPDTLRVLGIGNSFTNDAMLYLPKITEASGINNIIFAKLLYPGASLQHHLNFFQNREEIYTYYKTNNASWGSPIENYTINDAIQNENWDIIVLHQAAIHSGDYTNYQPMLNELIKTILLNCTNRRVSLAWQMTWAFASNSTHPGFPNYDNDQQTMYNAILDAVKSMKRETGIDIIIPSGVTIQSLRESYLNNPPYDLTSDGFHLDYGIGRYSVACTWFETLIAPVFRKTVLGNDYIPNTEGLQVTSENKYFIQMKAKEATILNIF